MSSQHDARNFSSFGFGAWVSKTETSWIQKIFQWSTSWSLPNTWRIPEFRNSSFFECIKVKFFPLDDSGIEIPNPSPEQLAQLQNDVATKLAPKFNDFRLEFDEDEDAPEKNVAAFQVPLSSFVSFVANVVFKK